MAHQKGQTEIVDLGTTLPIRQVLQLVFDVLISVWQANRGGSGGGGGGGSSGDGVGSGGGIDDDGEDQSPLSQLGVVRGGDQRRGHCSYHLSVADDGSG